MSTPSLNELARYVSEDVNDTFAFVTGWPALHRRSGKKDVFSHHPEARRPSQTNHQAQQTSRQWPAMLQMFRESGKFEDEFRAAANQLREITMQEAADSATESNAAYLRHLGEALQRLDMADGSRVQSSGETCHASSTVHHGKKRPCEDMSFTSCRKRMRSDKASELPSEITALIIAQTLITEPKCALSLIVPDWKVCSRDSPELERSLRTTRIVTYTKGIGSQVGDFSHTFGHEDEDHILTPMAKFDPGAAVVSVSFSSEYTRQYHRHHTHVFVLGANGFPIETGEEVSVGDWRDLMPLRDQRTRDLLPFDDELINAVKLRTTPFATPIYQLVRHIAFHSPLTLMKPTVVCKDKDAKPIHTPEIEALNNAVDLDRSAQLWLSWLQMPNLETVLLDLRIYSDQLNTERRCLSKFHIMERAREMARHLRLKTLMLAGLQSYSFYAEYDDMTERDIEEWDEIDGEPNWIKIFSPAVSPGGKIILVDRLND